MKLNTVMRAQKCFRDASANPGGCGCLSKDLLRSIVTFGSDNCSCVVQRTVSVSSVTVEALSENATGWRRNSDQRWCGKVSACVRTARSGRASGRSGAPVQHSRPAASVKCAQWDKLGKVPLQTLKYTQCLEIYFHIIFFASIVWYAACLQRGITFIAGSHVWNY